MDKLRKLLSGKETDLEDINKELRVIKSENEQLVSEVAELDKLRGWVAERESEIDDISKELEACKSCNEQLRLELQEARIEVQRMSAEAEAVGMEWSRNGSFFEVLVGWSWSVCTCLCILKCSIFGGTFWFLMLCAPCHVSILILHAYIHTYIYMHVHTCMHMYISRS
jgi:hypothetical protein